MREAKGWRPADLARAAKTTEGQISRYENRQRVPTAEVVAKLAFALQMSADFFLGLDNRFSELDQPRNVASCLTLEWHYREAQLDQAEYQHLMLIARGADSAPISVKEWEMVRDALAIVSSAHQSTSEPPRMRRPSRAKRTRPTGPS
jgi:transcriptional regulator with XRE-family HTH domain